MIDEPVAKLAQRQPVPHRHRPRPDEALPPRDQRRPFDRPPRRIGPVEHPHRLARRRCRLEHVEQGRDEGVDPAAEVLEVDQHDIERRHHRRGRSAHFAVQAEQRDPELGIDLIRGLDHIVLLVALDPVLRAERGGDVHAGRNQGIEAVRQVTRQAGGVRDQGNALALELGQKCRVGKQPIDTGNSHAAAYPSRAAKQSP